MREHCPCALDHLRRQVHAVLVEHLGAPGKHVRAVTAPTYWKATYAPLGAPAWASANQSFALPVPLAKVTVTEATDIVLTLLFDPEHDLEERILKEQFAP